MTNQKNVSYVCVYRSGALTWTKVAVPKAQA